MLAPSSSRGSGAEYTAPSMTHTTAAADFFQLRIGYNVNIVHTNRFRRRHRATSTIAP